MAAVPAWLVVLQGLLTPAIAIAVAVIAFLQWRTAHQKVVLDLFDRRLKAIEAIKDSIKPILRDGRLRQSSDAIPIYTAFRGARFLFGRDMETFLTRYQSVVMNIGIASANTENAANPDYQQGVTLLAETMLAFIDFYDRFDVICARYMHMDQKLIRWPWEVVWSWIRYLNRKKRK